MQVLAGVIFFVILLIAGLGGIVLGIAGLIISRAMRKAGRKFGKIATAVSAIWLAGALLLTAIPVGFFGFIYFANATPPEDYVDTDILIEGDIYRGTSFTADGKVYRQLYLDANSEGCTSKATPVFSYKPSGILNRSQWTNYYRIETDPGFDLIWDGGDTLYCRDEERDEIVDYYNRGGLRWVYSDWTDYDGGDLPPQLPLPADAASAMELYLKFDSDSLPETVFRLKDYETLIVANITVEGLSSDGVICVHEFSFDLSADGAFEPHLLYTNPAGTREQTAVRLPDEIGIPLSKIVVK